MLFWAVVVVVVGSLLGQWAGIKNLLGDLWFWIGNQGWEYLEIGRFWQILLAVGLLFWFWLVRRAVEPARANPELRTFVVFFLIAAFAIPFFYLPAFFFGAKTHYSIVDVWRFWIIHLWVEGFFEFFVTVIVVDHPLPARPGPAHHGDPRHLSRRHPLLRRRADRHRAPLVLHRPDASSPWRSAPRSPRSRSCR